MAKYLLPDDNRQVSVLCSCVPNAGNISDKLKIQEAASIEQKVGCTAAP